MLNALEDICTGAFDMPAFGVSLDGETREAMKSGYWLELLFDGEHNFNKMNFEALLINVNSDYTGFNIIRKVNGKYEGRCFFLNLNGTMGQLFDAIQDISKNGLQKN